MEPGANVEGICTNPNCPGYDKKVWVPLKFGFFNIGKIVEETVCRVCHHEVRNVDNIGYFCTKITIDGRLADTKKKFAFSEVQNDPSKISKFK